LVKYFILALFPLKNSKRGAKKIKNQTSPNLLFKPQDDLVITCCFEMKRGPGWGVVACDVDTQCQDLNWISVQTTGVVLLAPNFMT
jgi:hypothetical protein